MRCNTFTGAVRSEQRRLTTADDASLPHTRAAVDPLHVVRTDGAAPSRQALRHGTPSWQLREDTQTKPLVCVCVCVRASVCACVCVCVWHAGRKYVIQ